VPEPGFQLVLPLPGLVVFLESAFQPPSQLSPLESQLA
jgi:hypothetical protein